MKDSLFSVYACVWVCECQSVVKPWAGEPACLDDNNWRDRSVNLSARNWSGTAGHRGSHVSMGPETGVSEGVGARNWAGTASTVCLGASGWRDPSE